jgi:hypothetical protein
MPSRRRWLLSRGSIAVARVEAYRAECDDFRARGLQSAGTSERKGVRAEGRQSASTEADIVSQTHLAGGVDAAARETGRRDGPVYSTGLILAVFGIVFLLVIVIPALLWTAAILFGQ